MSRVAAPLFAAAILAVLAAAPVLSTGPDALHEAGVICVLIVLAASFSLQAGQAGLVSFAHPVFFALGAACVALAGQHLGAGWAALGAGVAAGAGAAAVLALAVGLVALRGSAGGFAMLTFVLAAGAGTAGALLAPLVGGAEGLAVRLPVHLTGASAGGAPQAIPLPGAIADLVPEDLSVTGRTLAYYTVFGAMLGLVLLMLRLVSAPFGRGLRAIRENPQRAEATGYCIARARLGVHVIAAVMAALAGAMWAVWTGQLVPVGTWGLALTAGLLLAVLVGGAGNLHGAVIGAALLGLAQAHLPALAARGAAAAADLPVLPALLAAERWPLWLGAALVAVALARSVGTRRPPR